MSYGTLNIDTITGSGASSVIINNGTNNVAGFTTGNNIQLLQNGGGIVFSNSSASVNSTLNDYETGTWTPTQGAGLTVVGTFSSAGTYTKIGNIVYINGRVSGSTSVALSAGGLISSLPFSCLGTAPGIAILGTACNNAGTTAIILEIAGSSLYALSGSIAATTTIFFTAVYQATF